MRKLYFTLLSLLIGATATAQYGQIPNGGFEYWATNDIYDYTTLWGCSNDEQWVGAPSIIQSTVAQNGSYSAEITAVEFNGGADTLFGYVYQGSIGGLGPDGGIPYTDQFDEVQFYYQSDLPPGDTLYLMAIRFSGGTQEYNLIPAAYGTVSSWTQQSVTLPNTTQDSLFLGFVLGDPFGPTSPTPGVWARVDNMSMYNGGNPVTNMPDPSFESWDVLTVESATDWYTTNELYAATGYLNASKTTDANSGNYAIEMTTIVHTLYGDTLPSVISMAPLDYTGSLFTPVPYAATPATFSGSYKYAPVNNDVGFVAVFFLEMGNIIGAHTETFTPAATYTSFSAPLTITGTPDSIVFYALSGDNAGSVLHLDDLSFSGGDVGISEFEAMEAQVYPNPTDDILWVKSEGTYTSQIVDLAGNVILERVNQEGIVEYSLSQLNAGTYFVRINNGHTVDVHKVIVQ